MNKKLTQLIHSALFILTIVSVGLVSIVNKPFNTSEVQTTTLLNGETARTLEAQYDAALFIKEFGVNLWAAVEYSLFNEGKVGLVVGQDGWLFTAEEFNTASDSDVALGNNIELIKWVNAEFAKRNITLVITPVPAKARVYEDKLLSVKPGALHQQTYRTLLNELQTASVHVTDSYHAMQQQRNTQSQFLRTDTHWTPAGAKTVAKHTADYINKQTTVELADTSYVSELKQTQDFSGDLFNYLPLSPWFDQLLPETDQLAVYETYKDAEDSLDDLFGDSTESVALVGTSYSANQNWNFVGALKQALSTDIISYAQEGHGPITPMMQFLETYQTEMPDLELVIWEIPERYLTVSYSEAYAKQEANEMKDTLIAQEFKSTFNFDNGAYHDEH